MNLDAIWASQQTTPEIDDAIESLAHLAFGVLTDANRPAANVTEWAKRQECWERMRAVDWRAPRSLGVDTGPHEAGTTNGTNPMMATVGDDEPITATGDTFLALEEWGKQTSSMTPFQRSLARRIGIAMKEGRELNSRLRPQASALLEEARIRGFIEP
jgi:hypothetical protein